MDSKFNRDEIIETLIDDDYEYISESGGFKWFHSILNNGFVGYDNMTDEELIDEYNERNLE